MVVPSIESGAGAVGSASGPNGSSVNATFFGFRFLRDGSKSGSSDMVIDCFEVGRIDVGRVGCQLTTPGSAETVKKRRERPVDVDERLNSDSMMIRSLSDSLQTPP